MPDKIMICIFLTNTIMHNNEGSNEFPFKVDDNAEGNIYLILF